LLLLFNLLIGENISKFARGEKKIVLGITKKKNKGEGIINKIETKK